MNKDQGPSGFHGLDEPVLLLPYGCRRNISVFNQKINCYIMLHVSKIDEKSIIIETNILGGNNKMTQEEIKKLDRRIRSIEDPFGTGFLVLYKTVQAMAEFKGKSMGDIVRQYTSWKLHVM